MKQRCILGMVPWLAAAALAQLAPAQRVEVVGSRLPRIDAETALPLQIFRRDEIERSGAGSVEELLDRISAASGGFRQAMGLGSGDTPGLSAASLRGFGAGETLVLLNGRRLANHAFTGAGGPSVDLHVIPLAAVERVEVLKDGASALYGSDAVAGVINFVTRQDYAGAEASTSVSATEAGGGARARATLALGGGRLAQDGLNLFGVLDLQRNQRLRASDRRFASTSYRPELGLDGTIPTAFPANVILLRNGRRSLVNPVAPDCPRATVLQGAACWYDPASTLDLTAPSHELTLLGRGTLRLGAETTGHVEVLAATSRIRFEASASPNSFLTSAAGIGFVLPPSSAYYPAALGLTGPLQLAYRTASLGGRTSEVRSDNLRLLAGVRSRWAGWDVDAALGINDSRSRQRFTSGYTAAQRVADALGSGLVNPFGPSGPQGDELLAAAELKGDARKAGARTQTVDLRGSRELMSMQGGPLGLAAGVEARHESLRDEQYPLVGDISGQLAAAPKQGRRTVKAAYAELLAPVLPGVELQLAARVDHYSDFGTAVSPKAALRLQPLRWAVLRASVGRGFRAPSLPELTTQATVEPLFTDAPDPARCPTTGTAQDCQIAVPVTRGGNAALGPQRSLQAGAGLVVEPVRGVQASVDVWRIRLRDIIGSLDAADVAADIARYEQFNVIRGPVDPAHPDLPGPVIGIRTVNQNLGDWQVDGTDLALSLQPTATPLGRWATRLDATYVRRAQQAIVAGTQVDLIGRTAPRWQAVLTTRLDRGPWSGTLSYRYRRGYTDQFPLPDEALRRVASLQTWDGQVALALSGRASLSLGVHNLLDRAPPFTNQDKSFQAGYDPSYADPLGRVWTLTLRISWP